MNQHKMRPERRFAGEFRAMGGAAWTLPSMLTQCA